MTQILVPILVFISVSAIGAAVLIGRSAKQARLRLRVEQFGPVSTTMGVEEESGAGLRRIIEQIGSRFMPSDNTGVMQKSMAQAGFFSHAAPAIYMGARLICLTLGLMIAAVFVLPMALSVFVKVMLILGGGWLLSLIPSLYVDLRRSQRATEIRHHLPDAVDMLEICVSAGMGLDMAWNSVAEEIRRVSPILADEMALTNLEIHLGATRADAMRHMAQRTGSDDLNSLVSTLVQSERFGTAVSDALRTFAVSMRELRQVRAAESAEKMGVKMLFPMIAFILPAILIVMGGGAIIKIMEMFRAL